MRKTVLIIFVLAISVLNFDASANAQNRTDEVVLTSKDYSVWRNYILPSEKERIFLSLPWQRTFADGIVEANRVDKPVLLWTMNGHPLGCT